MSNEPNPGAPLRRSLPWIVAGAFLLLYLATLNRWVSISSLPILAKVAGWDWTLPAQQPLLHAALYPFRFLPVSIHPIALNLLAAILGALTLGLLTRTVSILPHDRTVEQRMRERSEFSLLSGPIFWVPPVFAALVCGLELTFWEHATVMTGEMLDLLIFAYCIRALLEYRLDKNEAWLRRLALVYGLGAANNFAMVGFFPLFLTALIWIRGISFFNGRFLVSVAGYGLAGLMLYLLLPTIWMFKGVEEATFMEVLRMNLGSQKFILFDMSSIRSRAFLLALTSALPVAILGIRWPSSFGDTSAAGASVTNIMFRVIHGVFLVACCWVTLGEKFSPRFLGFGIPFLTFYYLGAIAIGYYSGYLLLVFTEIKVKHWMRTSAITKALNPLVRVSVLAVACALPPYLAWKNFAVVRSNNGQILESFAELAASSIQPGTDVLLGEDSLQLSLLSARFAREGTKEAPVLAHTGSLRFPTYHDRLAERYGDRWPKLDELMAPAAMIDPFYQMVLIEDLVRSNQVAYLNPSFGYYFERIWLRPSGLTYPLAAYNEGQIFPPTLDEAALETNKAFWGRAVALADRLQGSRGVDYRDANYVASKLSRSLNAWGVARQRAGDVAGAAESFARAVAINSNNIPASVNLEFNRQLAQGNTASLYGAGASIEERLKGNLSWDGVLSEGGPFDEPGFLMKLAEEYSGQSLFRQACAFYNRVAALQPTNFTARFSLANNLLLGGHAAEASAALDSVQKDFPAISRENLVELLGLKSSAAFKQGDSAGAEAILREALRTFPGDTRLLDRRYELERAMGKNAEALALLEARIKSEPNALGFQLRRAEVLLEMDQMEESRKQVDMVLGARPDFPAAQLFRVFIELQAKNYEEVIKASDKLISRFPKDDEHAFFLENAKIYKSIALMESAKLSAALELLDAVLDKNPGSVTAKRNRALLHMRMGDLNASRKDYTELLRFMPLAHSIHYGLGEIAYRKKENTLALKHFETYLKVVPEKASAEEKKEVEAKVAELKAKAGASDSK